MANNTAQTKKCLVCGEVKSRSDFHANGSPKGSLRPECKPCRSVKMARQYADERPQRQKEAYDRAAYLRHKFNMTLAQYEEMLAAQGGGCAICGSTEPSRGSRYYGRFLIDHDHNCCPGPKSCGRCIRGLLCAACNFAIGALRDDTDRLRKAISYLESGGSNR